MPGWTARKRAGRAGGRLGRTSPQTSVHLLLPAAKGAVMLQANLLCSSPWGVLLQPFDPVSPFHLSRSLVLLKMGLCGI